MPVESYRIVRFFMHHPSRAVRGKRRLTLEEARAHCSDPETSSSTCQGATGRRRTAAMGPWFDGYEQERR